ncbi:hypothetical protein RhiLY_09671 [Ceratobasidium sp. AG-Ba]|nr:hypothetical protein RhiLY_09671 [Ceratobasidium sp. AG-Ba]
MLPNSFSDHQTPRSSFRSEFYLLGSSEQPVTPERIELRATDLRHHWPLSKIRGMVIASLKRYGSMDNMRHFLFLRLISTAAVHSKDIWVRLERRFELVASECLRARPCAEHTTFSDVAIISCNKGELEGSGSESFYLKDEIKMPIPLLFMLDVLDIAPQNMSPDHQTNNRWTYASFIINAARRFCELTEFNDALHYEGLRRASKVQIDYDNPGSFGYYDERGPLEGIPVIPRHRHYSVTLDQGVIEGAE